jgi:hypothetical protein
MSRATATVALAAVLAVAVVAVVAGDSSDDSGTDGGDTTAERTQGMQSALDAARYYLGNEEGLSKSAVLQRIVDGGSFGGVGFSEEEVLWAVNHVGADWKAQAVEDAKLRERREPGISKKKLILYLASADGFSKAEAAYAVSHIGRDWNAEAVEVAKKALKAKALSKSQLIKHLAGEGFTDAHVRYAVEKVY